MLVSEMNVDNDQSREQPHSQVLRELEDREALAATAHDLCNHLQVVSSALGLIQRSVGCEASAAAETYFSGARSSLERASRLSRRIVDAGWSDQQWACRVSIAERLSKLRDAILLATGPAVLVEYAVYTDLPEVICVADSLDEAILNIVVNAGRAMPGGGRISISATCEMTAREGTPDVVLRVADTGCGMPPEVAARAFDARFTTRPEGEGSGIGLALVAAFANLAGGSAGLESRLGVGTIVTLRLPGVLKSAMPADRPLAR
jgi:signal transduction histidine kinase